MTGGTFGEHALSEAGRDAPGGRALPGRRAGGADELSLRLSLPSGAFGATLWSAAEGMLGEEKAEGAFEFELPATGVWHWLRAADDSGNDSVSVWLRATAD